MIQSFESLLHQRFDQVGKQLSLKYSTVVTESCWSAGQERTRKDENLISLCDPTVSLACPKELPVPRLTNSKDAEPPRDSPAVGNDEWWPIRKTRVLPIGQISKRLRSSIESTIATHITMECTHMWTTPLTTPPLWKTRALAVTGVETYYPTTEEFIARPAGARTPNPRPLPPVTPRAKSHRGRQKMSLSKSTAKQSSVLKGRRMDDPQNEGWPGVFTPGEAS
jgi:hypothetical protein